MLKGTIDTTVKSYCSQVWDSCYLCLPALDGILSCRECRVLKHQGMICYWVKSSNGNFLTVLDKLSKQLCQLQNKCYIKCHTDLSTSNLHEGSDSKPSPIPEKLAKDASFHLPKSWLFLHAQSDTLKVRIMGTDDQLPTGSSSTLCHTGDREITGETGRCTAWAGQQRSSMKWEIRLKTTRLSMWISLCWKSPTQISTRAFVCGVGGACLWWALQNPFDIEWGEEVEKSGRHDKCCSLCRTGEALHDALMRFLCIYVLTMVLIYYWQVFQVHGPY